IANHPKVNPRRDTGWLLRVEQRGSGPRIRLGYVGRGGEGRLQCRFARRVVDLTDEIPFFLRREIKNLRRAKVTVADLEHVALGLVGVLPICKRKILDLVGALLTADGAEQVPTAIVPDEGRILDGLAGVRRSNRGRD